MTRDDSSRKSRAIASGLTRRTLVKNLAAAGLVPPAISLTNQAGTAAAPRNAVRRQEAEKPASLTMLYATVEADVEAIKLAIPDFKAETGIDIVLDSQPYDALQQKVFAELAVDSPYYDVIIVDTPWTPALTGKLVTTRTCRGTL